MSKRHGGLLLGCTLVLVTACSSADSSDGTAVTATATTIPTPATTTAPTAQPATVATPAPATSPTAPVISPTTPTSVATPVTVATPPTVVAPTVVAPTATVPVATAVPDTTLPVETTTTTSIPPPPLDVFDPSCVVQVAAGESLTLITDRIADEIVTPQTVQAENGLAGDVIHPGQLLDVCVGNGLDDATGEQRLTPNEAVDAVRNQDDVVAQQTKLNELFAPYGTAPLLVDGVSGPVTRQRLCAFRLAMNLPVSTANMAAGSDEEAWLMAMTFLPVPPTSARQSERWILIDRTCQMMFVGAGPDQIAYVFPTSTGEAGYETRDQDRTRAFRYNPEVANGGWHNSTTYPVADDNPLNGNMYKPIYFDRGQAIHGAGNVPTSPQSKGCARLRVANQDLLVAWLGLGDVQEQTTSAKRINVTVNVQGTYVPA